MVTHEVDLIKSYNKRIVTIKNGTVVSDTAHPELEAQAQMEDSAQNAPSGYYHVPTEDAEIEDFLKNYGNENAEEALSEEITPEELSEADSGLAREDN